MGDRPSLGVVGMDIEPSLGVEGRDTELTEKPDRRRGL